MSELLYELYGYFWRNEFRKCGFADTIGNIILGLPKETTSMVLRSLNETSWVAITMSDISVLHVKGGEMILLNTIVPSFSEPEGAVACLAIENKPTCNVMMVRHHIRLARYDALNK